jgi:hypothetical protein
MSLPFQSFNGFNHVRLSEEKAAIFESVNNLLEVMGKMCISPVTASCYGGITADVNEISKKGSVGI